MIKIIMNSIHLILAVYLSFAIFLAQSAPQNAIVSRLPGFNGTLPSKHFAGYVTIDKKHGKKLYYYYVLSERNPAEDPVVLWLNGGPGCSSFDGFVYEHGPFNFEKTGGMPKLHLNPYTWTKVSNVIYLDSPVGVGMSYSNTQSDYIATDTKTALDSHKFLLEWFKLYPEFLLNPFFIAGESYAGAYVPMLSYEVVKGLDAGDQPTLNFKGYLVGNGVADEVFDGNALVPFTHGMGLIPNELYEEAGEWVICTDRVKYYTDVTSMLKYHKSLTARGYRALIYSGDHDMAVPFTGTQAWTRSLGYKIIDEWRDWFVDDQVAGFIQGYDNNLTFLTIKGSGHTVPEHKPKEAFAFYSRWLEGKPI